MAERVIRQIIDDIDKSEIAEGEGERIEFTFRGVAYQLDLSNANVAKLEKVLAHPISTRRQALRPVSKARQALPPKDHHHGAGARQRRRRSATGAPSLCPARSS